ncbi:MAG: redox-sensing transcriptional repressor Rex [Melioribacteraceae bacterium]
MEMIAEKQVKALSERTLRRLPRYIEILKRLKNEKIEFVSSNVIAEELGLDSIQVRKDLAATGVIGKPKLGFAIDELISGIKHTLNWDNQTDAFLVGAGSLGSAILGYKTFSDHGLNIIAAFENEPSKVGEIINNITILPIEKLADMAFRMKVHIGVITVPIDQAQSVADMMIEGGIRAIWNFAPTHLKVPDFVIVENAQLSHSLGVLTHKLAESLKGEYK